MERMTTEPSPDGAQVPAEAVVADDQAVASTEQVADTPQTVTIDGQEYTLDEARAAVMRQADYTRKTQDLAAERQSLAQAKALFDAIQADPRGSIEALQEHFADALQDNDDEVDPVEARLRRVESFESEQRQQAALAAVDAELTGLEQRYGQFDRNAVLQHAVDNNIGNLRAALLDLRESDPNVMAAQQRAAADAAALAAKQGLAPVAGGSAAAGATKPGGKPIERPSDALREALAEAGVDSIRSLL